MSARAAQLAKERRPYVHATVVRAQPPTSAHAGDEAILLQDGTIEGFVGGQCAQNSVRAAGLNALQSNESVLLRVLPDGAVDFPEAPGASVVVNPCLSGGAMEIFLEPQVPAPLVLLYGVTPIADAVARIAGVLGFTLQRNGSGGDEAESLGGVTALVIASHGGAEAELIRSALDAGVGYIGLVASRTRGAAVLAELGLDEAERARVHTPVGLWIGARTAPEIAVSIVAELIKALRLDGLATVAEANAATPPPEAIDPVCGMTVVIGSATPHLELSGEEYWFCSTGCRAAYARDSGT